MANKLGRVHTQTCIKQTVLNPEYLIHYTYCSIINAYYDVHDTSRSVKQYDYLSHHTLR